MPVFRVLAIAALAGLAACATAPTAEVTRFHLGQPIPADSVAVVPGPGAQADGLEFRAQADAIAGVLASSGFRPVGETAQPAYLMTFVAQGERHETGPRRSTVSIGIGGGSFGRGGGIGGSVAFPVGKPRADTVNVYTLKLQMRRKSDASVVWEGRAMETVRDGSLTDAVPGLARALLAGFPGESGKTIVVPVPR